VQVTLEETVGYLLAAGASPTEAATIASHARAESGFQTDAVNRSSPCSAQGNHAVGLFQICDFPERVSTYGDLSNPQNNAKAAVSIFRSQGEGAWTSSHNTTDYNAALKFAQGGRLAPSSPGAQAKAQSTGPIGDAITSAGNGVLGQLQITGHHVEDVTTAGIGAIVILVGVAIISIWLLRNTDTGRGLVKTVKTGAQIAVAVPK
jgi:hypothetical protein